MDCPKCDSINTRCVYVDSPAEFRYKLSKTNLRSSDVKIMGVNWDNAHWYCEDCGQTWMEVRVTEIRKVEK